MSDKLTHLDEQGRAQMVDVGDKPTTDRGAVATARLCTRADVVAKVVAGDVEKGDVLATARIAGTLAAKRTAELIPLCHPLGLDHVSIEISAAGDVIEIRASTRCRGRTGVEMEALTAASVAALTVYDMCKSIDREMVIEQVQLQEKWGGRSGHFKRGDR